MQADQPMVAREILTDLRSRYKPDVITYNVELYTCRLLGDTSRARAMWQEFKSSGLTPDQTLLCSLMRALGVEPDKNKVFAILDDAEAGGIKPDSRLYNHALKLLAEEGNLPAIQALLQRMQDKGVKRDVITWTTAISACQTGEDSLAMLQEMERNGVRPNEVTYARTIHVFAQTGDWEGALRLVQRMEALGMRNVVAFTSAMVACEVGQAYEQVGDQTSQ